MADFNLDGLVDLIVVNRNAPTQVWRNVTADAGGWLGLRLSQPGPNVDAIGAWIEVKTGETVQRREITSGGGHVSGVNGWWHFGIGAAEEAEVRVLWPDGSEGPWQKVGGNGFYSLGRGQQPSLQTP
ncbi:MAG: ASPIC/UnbV domain-containing protein [Paracoccaceae bacterium]